MQHQAPQGWQPHAAISQEAPDTGSSAAYPALPQPGLAPLRANLCRETPMTMLFLDSRPAKAASPNLLIWGS